ncbi:glycosyltransferase [Apilactobacillus sp. TMW 2.2459]|uniref:Glycosyltransferase n=1 Tax=Apilactobacillus xinyiensis TaxID=2841032 RepID=A0ABT0I300_9LACO|nr:glycosyltransferase [Apilactobacillus xinyiensis]MCK8625076.1 glycosyltransferase [Apilactobacillus xinyiensis]MCL0312763.1 glycosyltransferase [Apilactobacillus xinyiensis]MCL0330750.1 glycosyltransferase [Apilactobacillus xinyiensis]
MWFFEIINDFVIGYPIFVSVIWIVGCIYEAIYRRKEILPLYDKEPLVSILVPAHNEHDTLWDAVESISNIHYKNFEVILIDDKSDDDTLHIMYEIQKKYADQFTVKVIPIEVNQGKANAMNQGFANSAGKYIMGIDSDSIIAKDSVSIMVRTLESNSKLGAVAGKPVVRNRTTILGRLQLLEYIGVIDIIKKAQSFLYGRVNTVSGVIVGFRREALKDVNGWDPKIITEDIDITWRLYRKNWKIKYQPSIICWILVPENVRNLIKQRRRWARGGMEVLVKNHDFLIHSDITRKALLYETIISNFWAVLTALSTISYLLNFLVDHEVQLDGDVLLILIGISFLQFGIGFWGSKERAYLDFKDLLLIPIYVVYYWMINLISCITALVSFFLDPKQDGTWRSPDRGL